MKLDVFAELSGLSNSLDYHFQRHGVLAANLTNADTPNYEPKDVTFNDGMQAAPMALTSDSHLQAAVDERYQIETVPIEKHGDGNGVEIEQAMSQVMANRLRYETGIELARRRIALMRYAAQDGGG